MPLSQNFLRNSAYNPNYGNYKIQTWSNWDEVLDRSIVDSFLLKLEPLVVKKIINKRLAEILLNEQLSSLNLKQTYWDSINFEENDNLTSIKTSFAVPTFHDIIHKNFIKFCLDGVMFIIEKILFSEKLGDSEMEMYPGTPELLNAVYNPIVSVQNDSIVEEK
jgi:hypothetical protein